MRAIPIAVTALAAALALTACDSGGSGDSSSDKSSKAATCRFGIEVESGNAATTAGDTGNVPVTVTNLDSAACTLKGFPGIELKSGDASWTAGRQPGAKAAKVTLQPDAAATFTITYVRGKSGAKDSAAVKTVKITVPGGGDARSFPWSYGDVALKTGDDPNASVSPFQVAGD
ncbi:DUF4232 domain-containing protein [Streptomyces avermitilis]|uniref:DUF4232 domain-containing protein n=1 Tax=Streptomyces avermitilis TaxID=33903 RepID=UPI0033A34126